MPSYLPQDVIMEVFNRLTERVPNWGRCQICLTQSWTMDDGFASVMMGDDFRQMPLGPRQIPCVSVHCNNCGNTVLFNLSVLGLDDLVQRLGGRRVPSPEVPQATELDSKPASNG